MNLRQNFDRQNFLETEADRLMLMQLPPIIQTEVYTDFLFKDFLWKFRRIFRFSCVQLASFSMLGKRKKGKKGIKIFSKQICKHGENKKEDLFDDSFESVDLDELDN